MPETTVEIRQRIKRAFERAAESYDAAAVLQQEIGSRMMERLDYVKLQPRAVLDLGAGTGAALPALRKRYPRSDLIAFDLAHAMLIRARQRSNAWDKLRGRDAQALCGDFEQLPLRDAGIDLVWSNLTLQWARDTPRAFAEIKRVLAPNGLLMFTTFGTNTLRELRAAYQGAGVSVDAGVDADASANRFPDLRELGDLLLNAGFADPVMDMEHMTLTYTDARAVIKDLKAIGAQTVMGARRAGLLSRAHWAQIERNYETFRAADGRLPATFEIIYGHAWQPAPRTSSINPSGRRVIEVRATK